MPKDYFEKDQENNKNIFLKLAVALFNGIMFITSLRIDENLVGDGYRLTVFFNRKEKKWTN